MPDRPLVSIVMTSYNHARYIREAVDAVLGQSYDRLELLIVDDCSTDESPSILADYASRDRRVRVFRNEQNRGIILSVGRGREAAQGDYIYLAASDDKMLPGFLEKTVRLLEEYPQAGFCWTDPCHFFESGGPNYGRGTGLAPGPAYIPAERLAEFYRSGALSAPMHAAPALLRRSAFEDAGGFLSELRWYCDFFVTLVLAFRKGICYLPEPLTSTRVQQTSYSKKATSQSDVQAEVLGRMLDLLVSPAYRDVAPLVKSSGVLSYFGRPVYRVGDRDPKYGDVLDDQFRRRALYFSIKHGVRRLASPRFQRFYFSVRRFFRPSSTPASVANRTV